MRDFKLPSGATLQIQEAPFTDAKALQQAVLAEFRGIPISSSDMENVFKEFVCIGFSSAAIERALWKCLDRCLYVPVDGASPGVPETPTPKTLDPVDRRVDWVPMATEVARANIGPFMKSLFALYLSAVEAQKPQKSESKTTT
jgi:hypothetical protein